MVQMVYDIRKSEPSWACTRRGKWQLEGKWQNICLASHCRLRILLQIGFNGAYNVKVGGESLKFRCRTRGEMRKVWKCADVCGLGQEIQAVLALEVAASFASCSHGSVFFQFQDERLGNVGLLAPQIGSKLNTECRLNMAEQCRTRRRLLMFQVGAECFSDQRGALGPEWLRNLVVEKLTSVNISKRSNLSWTFDWIEWTLWTCTMTDNHVHESVRSCPSWRSVKWGSMARIGSMLVWSKVLPGRVAGCCLGGAERLLEWSKSSCIQGDYWIHIWSIFHV